MESVYCLANCAAGPSVRIGDAIYGRVTLQRLDALLEQATAQLLGFQPPL